MVGPQGMSLDGNELFVCDDFLKVFDISYPSNNLEIKYEINVQGNDLILNDNIMMILGDDGFSQYAGDNYRLYVFGKNRGTNKTFKKSKNSEAKCENF